MSVTDIQRYCQMRQYGTPRCLKLDLELTEKETCIACISSIMVSTIELYPAERAIYIYVTNGTKLELLIFLLALARDEQVLKIVRR